MVTDEKLKPGDILPEQKANALDFERSGGRDITLTGRLQ